LLASLARPSLPTRYCADAAETIERTPAKAAATINSLDLDIFRMVAPVVTQKSADALSDDRPIPKFPRFYLIVPRLSPIVGVKRLFFMLRSSALLQYRLIR
jgi:hypothetical protein